MAQRLRRSIPRRAAAGMVIFAKGSHAGIVGSLLAATLVGSALVSSSARAVTRYLTCGAKSVFQALEIRWNSNSQRSARLFGSPTWATTSALAVGFAP